jgi:hypothetical protein
MLIGARQEARIRLRRAKGLVHVDQVDERRQGGFLRGSLRHVDSLAGIVAAGTSITRGR